MDYWNTIAHPHWICLSALISEINARFSGKENEILHPGEFDVFAKIRSQSYRESWFAGRVLTKNLYMQQSVPVRPIDWREIQIVSRNDAGRSVAPRLLAGGKETGFFFSLSHVADRVAVVALVDSFAGIGCDLVLRGTTTQGIVNMFFHDDEVQDQSNLDAVWAVKEAVYKACQCNESFQPRQWLTKNIGENRYCCHHVDGDRQLFAEAETVDIDDYILAVARKTSECYSGSIFKFALDTAADKTTSSLLSGEG
ncbi:MAG: 4'-phosphopantetheinyl transferase superfamily protein [Planctomycetaceae bacterium]|jgi:phosphopantetheinyl transferase|nr:4'-phosphopantetheinyl transferase superfamily protein [Planctomycetaceae bacterium]